MKTTKKTLSFINHLETELLDYHVFSNKFPHSSVEAQEKIDALIDSVKEKVINLLHHNIIISVIIDDCEISITKKTTTPHSVTYKIAINADVLNYHFSKQLENREFKLMTVINF